MSLLEVFCDVDDFSQAYLRTNKSEQLPSGKRQRQRQGEMHLSELLTLMIHFHQSHYRNFKAYYTEYVCVHLRSEFPNLVSYGRFVELMPRLLKPLSLYLQRLFGRCIGVSFIDSTALAVCRNQR